MALDWKNLGFQYLDTHCHIKYTCTDGQWDTGELMDSPYLNIHIAATALHYGQAAFEGLKAFRGSDGEVRIFRPEKNAERMRTTARRTFMAEVPTELFVSAIKKVVTANEEFIPPYGTGGSLYIRPLLIGSGPKIGVEPSAEYSFIVLVNPVGAYYKGGLNPVNAMVVNGYDRAAPNGVGHVKVAGNYAASLEPASVAKQAGFPINLYLDAKEHRFIDEFGTSNFIALKDNTYITPDSDSILPSITNMSLMQIAEDFGMKVERRPIEIDELNSFEQIAACGTAVVVTPVHKIVTANKIYEVGDGTVTSQLQQLFDTVTGIQYGEIEDRHNWCELLD